MNARAKIILHSGVLSALIAISFAMGVGAKELSASSDPADLRAYVLRVSKMPNPTEDQLIHQASAYEWLKDYDGASRAYQQLLKLKPDSIEVYSTRALMYKKAHRLEDALKDFQKMESLGYKETGLYVERMAVKLLMKDYEGANRDADIVLRTEPKNANAYFVKGRVAFKTRDTIRSVDLLTKAMEYAPNKAPFIQARGEALQKLGRVKEARSDFERAKELGWTD